MKSLCFKLNICPANVSAADVKSRSCVLRCLVFIDRQPNSANPTNLNEILDNTAVGFINAPILPTNKQRFVVLYDQKWPMFMSSSVYGVNMYTNNICITKEFDLNGLSTTYSGPGGAFTDISTNSLKVLLFGRFFSGDSSINDFGVPFYPSTDIYALHADYCGHLTWSDNEI